MFKTHKYFLPTVDRRTRRSTTNGWNQVTVTYFQQLPQNAIISLTFLQSNLLFPFPCYYLINFFSNNTALSTNGANKLGLRLLSAMASGESTDTITLVYRRKRKWEGLEENKWNPRTSCLFPLSQESPLCERFWAGRLWWHSMKWIFHWSWIFELWMGICLHLHHLTCILINVATALVVLHKLHFMFGWTWLKWWCYLRVNLF